MTPQVEVGRKGCWAVLVSGNIYFLNHFISGCWERRPVLSAPPLLFHLDVWPHCFNSHSFCCFTVDDAKCKRSQTVEGRHVPLYNDAHQLLRVTFLLCPSVLCLHVRKEILQAAVCHFISHTPRDAHTHTQLSDCLPCFQAEFWLEFWFIN